MIRTIVAFVAAVALAAAFGSIVQSQFNMAAIVSLGVDVSAGQWLLVTLQDLVGFAPVWALVVALALAIGFVVAGLLARYLPDVRTPLYFLAGGVAVMCALSIMSLMLPVTPLAGARGPFGMALIALGGAFGGLLFARMKPAHRTS